ncbi:porin family protein [Flavobacterium sp.]|uniref:porin family protein n=1 Tax=Flavobacterium sp. TaxID=239 RepID=UPI002B4ADFE3|nr:porin family protein [Flavobacterium sp.]HLF53509.1 porin family protein [Flavobacterium sp.]
MKKSILLVVAIFTFGFANAQYKNFGLKGGLNVCDLSNSEASALIGFHVGGFAEFMVMEKFTLQPELLFSTQGAKYDNLNFNLIYINLPVMGKYYVIDDFSIEAGPQIGLLVSAKEEDSDVIDSMNEIDICLNLGLGYNLNENMMLQLRYNLGLSEIEKRLPSGIDGSKNRVMQLSFGYKF